MTFPLQLPCSVDEIRAVTGAHVEPTVRSAISIAEVAAPTGDEGRRAAFVASILESQGYAPEVDDIGNVYARRDGDRERGSLMLVAHTDTVFPAGTDVTVRREGYAIFGPGVGDNSLGVAAMVEALAILDELKPADVPEIIAVASVGEEGLGNLRGVRAAVDRFRTELGAVVAVEGHNLGRVTHAGVGSLRWRVTVTGPGGHSWGAFGKPSAIHGLGRVIAAIDDLEVPSNPKTTFNVGVIEGGTSINTISPRASALIDMRSVDASALSTLAAQVGEIVARAAGPGLETAIEVLGERPAGSVALDHPFVRTAGDVLRMLGFEPVFDASSTDANIPISQGIPSVCIGVSRGGYGHTVNEYIEVSPIELGLAQLVMLASSSQSAFQPIHRLD